MRRILIIDDEPAIREVTARCLHATTNWLVETAASGLDGIRCAAASSPDVILLDHSMPGMDGPSTLREVRSIPSLASIPVIFLTARRHFGHEANLGATATLSKPFDPRTLGRQIASVLCWS